MKLGKKVTALGLTGIMALGAAAIDELSLNTNEADNKVRQGIISEWMGVSRARAEDVESLEEFVEGETKEEEKVEEGKVKQTISERYPELVFKDGEFDEEKFQGLVDYMNEKPHFVYSAVISYGEHKDVSTQFVSFVDEFILNLIYDSQQIEAERDIHYLGGYTFNPDDLLFYRVGVDKNTGEVRPYIFSANDFARIIDYEKTPVDFDMYKAASGPHDTINLLINLAGYPDGFIDSYLKQVNFNGDNFIYDYTPPEVSEDLIITK